MIAPEGSDTPTWTSSPEEGAAPGAGGRQPVRLGIVGIAVLSILALMPVAVVVAENALPLLPLLLVPPFGTWLIRRADSKLSVSAQEDPATQLPARVRFAREADRILAIGEGQPAVLVVDLDGFSDVETVLGQDRAESVLNEVGRRIRDVAKPWLVGSLGGERFGVAMRARPFMPAHHLARQIRTRISEPLQVEGINLRLRSCVGIAQGTGDAEALVRRASVAAVDARNEADGLLIHHPEKPETVRHRLAVVTGLSNALDDPRTHRFRPEFQPIVDADGVLVAAEALARWDDPVLGSIPPDVFIPLAEQTGLVSPLFSLIFDRAIDACRSWRETGLDATVSVNLSALNLRDPLLISEMTAKLDAAKLKPKDVTLEITESAVIVDEHTAMRTLRELRQVGFKVALDDFGVGQSSLSRLKDLPVNSVKLDKSFTLGVPADQRSMSIVRATVDVCKALGLDIVAEGVETNEQADTMIGMGVGLLQGFLFSPAITLDRLTSETDRQVGS